MRELADDAADSDTERMIEAYRRKRLADISRETKRARFGEVAPIGRDDYKREVTEASEVNEDGDTTNAGTGVVCFLYKDAYVSSLYHHFNLLTCVFSVIQPAIACGRISVISLADIHGPSSCRSWATNASQTIQTRTFQHYLSIAKASSVAR